MNNHERSPIRELRVMKGLTIKEISDITKLSQSYISRLETGARRLNEDTIRLLSRALDCAPQDLMGSMEDDSPRAPQSKISTPGILKIIPIWDIIQGKEGYTLHESEEKRWLLESLRSLTKGADALIRVPFLSGTIYICEKSNKYYYHANCYYIVAADDRICMGKFYRHGKTILSLTDIDITGAPCGTYEIQNKSINYAFRIIGNIV